MVVVLMSQDNSIDPGEVFECKYTWRIYPIFECVGVAKLFAQQRINKEGGGLRLEQPPLMAKERRREHGGILPCEERVAANCADYANE